MRRITTLADVQIILNELLNWRDSLGSRSRDMRKFQIKNLGAAVDPDDAVTLQQVRDLIAKAIIEQP